MWDFHAKNTFHAVKHIHFGKYHLHISNSTIKVKHSTHIQVDINHYSSNLCMHICSQGFSVKVIVSPRLNQWCSYQTCTICLTKEHAMILRNNFSLGNTISYNLEGLIVSLFIHIHAYYIYNVHTLYYKYYLIIIYGIYLCKYALVLHNVICGKIVQEILGRKEISYI